MENHIKAAVPAAGRDSKRKGWNPMEETRPRRKDIRILNKTQPRIVTLSGL